MRKVLNGEEDRSDTEHCRAELPQRRVLSRHLGSVVQDRCAEDDSIYRERRKPSFSYPADEPRYRSVGNEEGNHKPNGQDNPLMGVNLRYANRIFCFSPHGFQQVVAGRYEHSRDG